MQTTVQPYNLAAHLSLTLQKSWSKSVLHDDVVELISFHHKLCCLWQQMLTVYQPASSYVTLACGSKHHQLKISCQAIVNQICSMCQRNVCRTKAVTCCISEAGKKLSYLPPVPLECWCVNWGVTVEHTEHECEEFLFPKSLAGACRHTYCTCNLP